METLRNPNHEAGVRCESSGAIFLTSAVLIMESNWLMELQKGWMTVALKPVLTLPSGVTPGAEQSKPRRQDGLRRAAGRICHVILSGLHWFGGRGRLGAILLLSAIPIFGQSGPAQETVTIDASELSLIHI